MCRRTNSPDLCARHFCSKKSKIKISMIWLYLHSVSGTVLRINDSEIEIAVKDKGVAFYCAVTTTNASAKGCQRSDERIRIR